MNYSVRLNCMSADNSLSRFAPHQNTAIAGMVPWAVISRCTPPAKLSFLV